MASPRLADILERWVAAGVFLVVTGVAIFLAAPGLHWLDSAEFAAASFELGNAHPPGHPLPVALGKLATLLPLGGIAFRVSCLSALALGVASVVLLFIIHRTAAMVHRALQDAGDDELGEPLSPAVSWPLAAAGALGFGLSEAALLQGVRAEVYALNIATNLGLLHLALRYLEGRRLRDLLGAGLLAGLALGNHHLLTLATLPAVFAAALLVPGLAWRRRLGRTGAACLAGLLGLGILVQLPVRSTQTPMINWGAPHSVSRFGWTVSARLFTRTAKRSVARSPTARLWSLLTRTADIIGPGLLLAALGGFVLLGLRRRMAVLLTVLGLAALGNAAACLLAGFEPTNPDSLGYALMLLGLLLASAATILTVGLGRLHPIGRWRKAAVTLALLAVVLWPLQAIAGSFSVSNLRQAHAAELTADALVDTAPPGALLTTSYYQSGFLVWASRVIDGARPDLDHVHRSYLGQPGYVINLVRRRPGLAALLEGVRSPGALDYARLGDEARRRPVFYEFDDDTVGPDLLAASVPFGPLAQVLPPAARAAARQPGALARSQRRWLQLSRRWKAHRRAALPRMYLLWVHYLNARYHRLRGDCAAGRWAYDQALTLGNPKDPALGSLARDCHYQ